MVSRNWTAFSLGAAYLLAARGLADAQILTENAGVISPEVPIVREAVGALWAEYLREVRYPFLEGAQDFCKEARSSTH